jgi:hypothetical protein
MTVSIWMNISGMPFISTMNGSILIILGMLDMLLITKEQFGGHSFISFQVANTIGSKSNPDLSSDPF